MENVQFGVMVEKGIHCAKEVQVKNSSKTEKNIQTLVDCIELWDKIINPYLWLTYPAIVLAKHQDAANKG